MNKLLIAFAIIVGAMLVPTLSVDAAGNGNGIEVVSPISNGQYCPPGFACPNRWRELDPAPVVELFINKPIHNAPAGTYNKANVPLEYRVKWGVCENEYASVRVVGRFDANGGKHSNLEGTSDSNWQMVHSRAYATDRCGKHFCLAGGEFGGNVNLSNLKSGAKNTTLQMVAKWHQGQQAPNDVVSSNDEHIKKNYAHGINLWINFEKPESNFACVVQKDTVKVNEKVAVYLNEGKDQVRATWTARGGKPDTAVGTRIITSYATAGTREVTATFNGKESTCRVTVLAPDATPTPTPTPVVEVDKGIEVSKTDHKDLTRPGHTLTYVITVKNPGNVDLFDVKITDEVPGQLTVTKINNNGSQNGKTITWSNISLEAGETKEVSFTAKVKDNTSNGHLLVNDVKACSNDYDVCDENTDTTRVEKQPQVAAVKEIIHVPVTAQTGAGAVGFLATAIGIATGAYTIRKGF